MWGDLAITLFIIATTVVIAYNTAKHWRNNRMRMFWGALLLVNAVNLFHLFAKLGE